MFEPVEFQTNARLQAGRQPWADQVNHAANHHQFGRGAKCGAPRSNRRDVAEDAECARRSRRLTHVAGIVEFVEQVAFRREGRIRPERDRNSPIRAPLKASAQA